MLDRPVTGLPDWPTSGIVWTRVMAPAASVRTFRIRGVNSGIGKVRRFALSTRIWQFGPRSVIIQNSFGGSLAARQRSLPTPPSGILRSFVTLFGSESRDFNDRAHFMAVAATAMRQILIGNARRKSAAKRGAEQRPATFEEVERALATEPGFVTAKADALLALDRALERLHLHSERHSRIVECRFFGGMSIEETAAALGVSPATVKRDWSMAQPWLHREIQRDLG